eukprot:9502740-Pyramimonas_sp.AAC.1
MDQPKESDVAGETAMMRTISQHISLDIAFVTDCAARAVAVHRIDSKDALVLGARCPPAKS